jgi:hypothetical protein
LSLRSQVSKVHVAWMEHFGDADVCDCNAADAIKQEADDSLDSPGATKRQKRGHLATSTNDSTNASATEPVSTKPKAPGKTVDELTKMFFDGMNLTETQATAVSSGPRRRMLYVAVSSLNAHSSSQRSSRMACT